VFGDVHLRRTVVVGLTALAGVSLAAGCGSDSSDSAESPATTAAASASPTASETAPATTAPATTAAPTATTPEVSEATKFYLEQVKAGTVRLAASMVGVKGGKLVVQPAGLVHGVGTHFYKPGTVVSLKARDGGNAKFAGWSGVCEGSKRACQIKITDKVRALAGFNPKDPNKPVEVVTTAAD
jgi:hypothetical protein